MASFKSLLIYKVFNYRIISVMKRHSYLSIVSPFNYLSHISKRCVHRSQSQHVLHEKEKMNELKRRTDKRLNGQKYGDTSVQSIANRLYLQNENEYALQIIEASVHRRQTTDGSEASDASDGNDSTAIIYNDLITLMSSNFDTKISAIEALTSQLEQLSTTQLTGILSYLTTCSRPSNAFESAYYKLWSSLDEELTKRFHLISIHDERTQSLLLNVANLFYNLYLGRLTKFNRLMVSKLSAPDSQLNISQLLHLLFHLNIQRFAEQKTVAFMSEQLEKHIQEMTIDEIAVACMAYFKTQNKFPDSLIKQIVEKAISEIDDKTTDMLKTCIFKAVRYCYNNDLREIVIELINKVKESSQSLSEMCFVHFLLLVNMVGVYEKKLLDEAFFRLHSNPSSFRSKDMERMLFCLSDFCHDIDKNKLAIIADDVFQRRELLDYPGYLITITYYLCVYHYFPKKIIEHCFERKYLDIIFRHEKFDLKRSLLALNTILTVEHYEEYKNILLSQHRIDRLHHSILQSEKSSLGHKTRKTQLLNEVYLGLMSEYGKKIHLAHIFPFISYPIIIILNDESNMSLINSNQLREGMFAGCKALLILAINDYSVNGKILKGSTALQIRLLKRLGFQIIQLPWFEFVGFKTRSGLKKRILKEFEILSQ